MSQENPLFEPGHFVRGGADKTSIEMPAGLLDRMKRTGEEADESAAPVILDQQPDDEDPQPENR